MIRTLHQILQQSWERLSDQTLLFLPNLLAMLVILTAGWMLARLAQWTLQRTSRRLENYLRRWGVSLLMDHFGSGGSADLCARGAFWIIFTCAILTAIDALNTTLGSRLVAAVVTYLPRLLTAGVLLLGGLLLGRFLSRSVLIWAVNEGIGPARSFAAVIRGAVGLLTVVAAAEHLGVARAATLATLIILLSGATLAAALAVGLGCRKRVEQWLDQRAAFLPQQTPLEHL